jgi:amino acid adenylation domain-containing protein
LSVSELLGVLSAQGVELWFEGDRLRFRSPKGALSPEQRAELVAKKAEILAHLRAEAIRTSTTFPLSFSQQALWFLHQQAPHSASYHIAMSVRVLSVIDEDAMRLALQALVDRHATLRTTYTSGDTVPFQRVSGHAPAALDVHSADPDDAGLRQCIETDYRRPFDLEQGPVLRASLYTRSSTDHVLLLTVHHIAADGWSLLMLFEELFKFYGEFTGGQAAAISRPERQFSDYLTWQRELLTGPEHDRMWSYWRDKLAPPRATLDLPTDRLRPAALTFRGASFGFELTAEQTERLNEFARRERVTLFVVLLASFHAFLHRLTGADDVTVGTPIFARSKTEFMSVVGDFVNPLPMRGRFNQDTTFRALISQLKQTVHEALGAQEFPLPLLVQRLHPTRDAARSPLFDTFFVFQRFDQFRHIEALLTGAEADGVVELSGLRLAPYPIAQQEGQFDLALQMLERGGILHGVLKYSTDLFDESTIGRMVAQYKVLLGSVVEEPDSDLSTMSILASAEQEWLQEVNATESAYPEKIVPRLIEDRAARHPERIALQHEDARLTYRELNARANRLAHRLRDLGVRPGSLVGICLPRSTDLVVTLLGVLKSGGAYVPLDPGFPASRLAYMLADSGVRVLVTGQEARAAVEVPAEVQVVDLEGESDLLGRLSDANLLEGAAPRDPAYVIYTSGSTGRPKGVVVPHRALVNFLWSMKREPGLSETDVMAAVTTISFDIAALELYLPLLVGARIELVARDTALDGEALGALLDSSGATVLQATPATWRLLVEAGWQGTPGFRALCGGEALPRGLADLILERVAELWNLYGPTETTVWSTLERIERGLCPITIGRPIANTQIYVMDPAGQPVPIGVPGELWIGGPGVALGYHNRPELTSDRFVSDRFSSVPSARLYRTGDLGRWGANGRLHHLGRLDHQVKIRGFRIELGEIESVLCQHPQVREAIVLTISDTPDQQRLVAYVVASAPAPVVSELREHLRKSIPDYMLPAGFVFIDKLPMTYNAKVDRNALPAPDAADTVATDEYQAPVTETEKGVAQVFAEVLNIPAVGLRNNFFELGGHSLLATRTLARLRERFEIDVPLTAIFQAPTVEGLSRWLDAALEPGSPAQLELAQVDRLTRWKCLVPAPSNSSRPPLFMITGYTDEHDTLRILSNLIPHLGPDRPLCGLRPRWLDGHSPQYSSVAEMRDEYLRELRAFQPEGPYYLLGDCVGGVVAVEMARTLLEQGDEVALLILLDTERPRFHSFLLNEVMNLWHRGHHVASVLRQLLRPTEGTRSQVISDVMRRKLRRAGLSKHPITISDYIYQQRYEYQRLLKKHRLKRYPGRIRLIVSDDIYRFVGLLGWDGFADGGVEVSRTPGNHLTFRAQYGRELGQQLRLCIDQARSEWAKRVSGAAASARSNGVLNPEGKNLIAE